jgi:lipoprotein-anchoring transpeptidase ErfK/SrfK
LLAISLASPVTFAQAQDSQDVSETAVPIPPQDIPAQVQSESSSKTEPVSKPKSAQKSAEAARGTVRLAGYSPGTIVVKTRERRLYYLLDNGTAVRYPVGVGRTDKQWAGQSAISGKYLQPAWSPPEDLKRANPHLPPVIPSGAPNNPMGAAAMTLAGGEYAIHGTNRPDSVGGFVSWGCIRMHNADILDLFARVAVGTPVIVER